MFCLSRSPISNCRVSVYHGADVVWVFFVDATQLPSFELLEMCMGKGYDRKYIVRGVERRGVCTVLLCSWLFGPGQRRC